MSTPRPIASVSTTELYNRWAKVYDTDGNILQALDTHLLPPLLANLGTALPSPSIAPLTVTELGCGTGRNTLSLLSSPLAFPIAKIHALDLSPHMLSLARQRYKTYLSSHPPALSPAQGSGIEVHFHEYDALHPSDYPAVEAIEGKADLVLSTLVLEHLPLDVFFRAVKALLRREGGWCVLTNMHAEMGRRAQAGFVDGETGEKIRGESYVYEIGEVLEEARRSGFRLVGEVEEGKVREEDVGVGRMLGERGRKWIGVRVWFGMVLRCESG